MGFLLLAGNEDEDTKAMRCLGTETVVEDERALEDMR
jgi:hypothetical protein